jgi:hypothetical protein
VLFMRVEGEKPLNLLGRGHVMLVATPCQVGPPRGTTPLEPGNHSHRLAPRKPPGPVWCGLLPNLVPFRYVPPSLARSGGVIPGTRCIAP